MAQDVQLTIHLTDDECTAIAGLSADDRSAFLFAKLYAAFGDNIAASVSNANVLPLLSQAEQAALAVLVVPVRPSGGGGAVPNG